MKKNKIRDEQKGIIFLIFIFLVVVLVSLYSWFVLKPKNLEYGDQVIRTLFLGAFLGNNLLDFIYNLCDNPLRRASPSCNATKLFILKPRRL